MSKGLFFTVFFLIAAVAAGLMATGMGLSAEVEKVVMPELSEKQQAMTWAAQQGRTLFLYENGEGYALCEGTLYLVKLTAGKRRSIDLTGQEALNLSLCKQSTENPSVYAKVRDISGTSPGDYLVWDTDDVLNWSRYTAD